MKRVVTTIFFFAIVASFTLLIARSFRVEKIPYGSKFGCANCHTSASGGGSRNAFGQAVATLVTPGGTEDFWDAGLATLDSDGDGFTNGEELQDPTGTFTLGDENLVTNPGDATSFPNPTGITSGNLLPSDYQLYNNYPNPFNPSTTISFNIPREGNVSIVIYNSNGEVVTRLINKEFHAGTHSTVWNGYDDSGSRVASGRYIYKMSSGDFRSSQSMILLK